VSARRRVVAALAVLALLLTGCAHRPSAQVRYRDAKRVYDYTTTLADAVVAHAREVFPELTFDLNYTQKFDDDWIACSGATSTWTEAPETIQWIPDRQLIVSPAEPPGTVHLVEPIAQAFLDHGWTIDRDQLDYRVRPSLQISKDGVAIRFSPTVTDDDTDDGPFFLKIFVIGPCQFSPDDFADFDPADPDAYFTDD
jgi:hypothetical protein